MYITKYVIILTKSFKKEFSIEFKATILPEFQYQTVANFRNTQVNKRNDEEKKNKTENTWDREINHSSDIIWKMRNEQKLNKLYLPVWHLSLVF